MQKDLKLSNRQIDQYERYRVYYSSRIQRADRIENRNRAAEVAKLSYDRERMLLAVVGQRSMDSIRWWAEGSRYGISLNDWLRQRQAQRQRSASLRKIASR